MNAPTRRMAHSVTSEFDLHVYAAQLLAFCAAPGVVWFHCPNGEHRSPRTGARLKKMGLRRGVADFCLTLPTDGKSAYLELKSATGSLTAEQRAFQSDVLAAGGLYATANSPEAVQTILGEWGAIEAVPRRRFA